ncbi:hypothetical protein [Cylindrospermum sp. FACHB-282]|uniref:hypothetical protein n=1 Tax=Cylindrospermum sp. FACHB-282 TaxID=2692794 RepID=UPI0016825BAA|nr:hypothetical protein [Cylindrospermum sp. FACHB-282]MBD2384562.1 hypothetical protein [Cylindrospermum sp. FACHB-282]
MSRPARPQAQRGTLTPSPEGKWANSNGREAARTASTTEGTAWAVSPPRREMSSPSPLSTMKTSLEKVDRLKTGRWL